MNSLFIGLGGTGANALGVLQKKFEDYDLASGTHSLNNYLYVDTDIAIRNKNSFIETNGDFLQIGAGQVPSHIMDWAFSPHNAENPNSIRFKEWIDKNNPSLRAHHDFTTGAAGERMLTRMAVWSDYERIKHKLREKLLQSNGAAVNSIFVISGTCGGTGGGCLIDILYMLREIETETNMTEFPFVYLMLVMPKGYIETNSQYGRWGDEHVLNAYGLLWELNEVLKDRWCVRKFKTDANGCYINPEGQVTTNPEEYVEEPNLNFGKKWSKHSVRPSSEAVVDHMYFQPFDRACLFDSYNHYRRQPYCFDTISKKIADFIFSLDVGDYLPHVFDSVANRILYHIIDSAKTPYIKGFCTARTFTIQTHEELLKRYVQERFVYQMMQHGFWGKDGDYPSPTTSDAALWEELNGMIEEYIASSWQTIEELYRNVDKTELYDLLTNIKHACTRKEPSFDTVFPRLDKRNGLQMQFARMCGDLKETVLNKCGEWIVQYNLEYAKDRVNHEDYLSTFHSHKATQELLELRLPNKLISSKTQVFQSLKKAFELYISVLFNRSLSDHGCFDECHELLYNVTKALNFEGLEISPMRRLAFWEHDFIKDMMDLLNVPTKKFVPDVSSLFADNWLRDRNLFSDRYEHIIPQKEGTILPNMDMPIDSSGMATTIEGTLPYYKEKIVQEICSEIPNFTELFRPDRLKSEHGFVIERFLEYTKREALKIVNNPDNNLSIPIEHYINTEHDLSYIAQTLVETDGIYFSPNQREDQHPLRSFYLGHFNGSRNAQLLETAIRNQSRFNFAEQSILDDQSPYYNDRYVKVMVQTNYDISDYAYFEEYREMFEEYYRINKNDETRHQPFSSIQFWNNLSID